MSLIKKAEEHIYQAVLRGELEIDPQGRVWRIGIRGGDRWGGGARTNKCARRRAEKLLPSVYLMVRAMLNGKRMSGAAHRLVWRDLHGPLPDDRVINHINGIKSDNRPENLELVTRSENSRHAVRVLRVGTTVDQNGEKNPAAKLTAAQVNEIRLRRSRGERLKSIAADYGVTDRAISKIALGQRWAS